MLFDEKERDKDRSSFRKKYEIFKLKNFKIFPQIENFKKKSRLIFLSKKQKKELH